MKQYHELLKAIKEKGTLKSAAREGMPGTISLFGYQMRFNLQEGFPLVTTKKVSFKNIVVELLWFLKGDTNIKFLIDNGCNVWNQDAYNYYLKVCKGKLPIELLGDTLNENGDLNLLTFEEFTTILKVRGFDKLPKYETYTLGDCGKQYGWLWRNWQKFEYELDSMISSGYSPSEIDQLKELIEGLKNNPMSRRHIITAWNPATLDDMALNACHAFVQFNCRPIEIDHPLEEDKDEYNMPKYYLDCQLYQRSADVVLGVPYNIASYALLTEKLCKICNMVPGDYIHTFGDVHIYENHLPAVEEQLQRECRELPTLRIETGQWTDRVSFLSDIDNGIIKIEDFKLDNYNPYPKLENETELFTGLKK